MLTRVPIDRIEWPEVALPIMPIVTAILDGPGVTHMLPILAASDDTFGVIAGNELIAAVKYIRAEFPDAAERMFPAFCIDCEVYA